MPDTHLPAALRPDAALILLNHADASRKSAADPLYGASTRRTLASDADQIVAAVDRADIDTMAAWLRRIESARNHLALDFEYIHPSHTAREMMAGRAAETRAALAALLAKAEG